MVEAQGAKVVYQSDDRQEAAPRTGILIIEIIGEGRYVEQAHRFGTLCGKQGVACAEQQEKHQEQAAVEQHRLAGRETKQAQKRIEIYLGHICCSCLCGLSCLL